MRPLSAPFRAVGVLACALVLSAGLATSSPPHTASATGPSAPRAISAWLPYWNADTAYTDALAHTDQLHTVSPFWYEATSDASIKAHPGADDQRIVDGPHAKKIRVVPTVTETLDATAMAALLNDPARRTAHVDALMKIAESGSYDGLDLDYEKMAETKDDALRERVRTGYNKLADELCAMLHNQHMQCVLTVMPRTRTTGHAFDYAHLGRTADRLRIMGYDLHWAKGGPGPISSLAWYEEILAHATAHVPRAKLEVALPGYGWDWTVGSRTRARHVTWHEAEALRRKKKAVYVFDTASGTPHFAYTDDGGKRHEVWYQDARGTAAHLNVVRKHGIAATGLWALGFEDPAMWEAVADR
ncbi:glycosyl hydrolase family 18 protein [Streptomyces sp. NPDC021093]|uniref:glycosyl hydrolase family 18 protein n=1 Tax=Streptomyces sp. NPDC021093 TaxID=3365112 RepID=UPI0037A1CB82